MRESAVGAATACLEVEKVPTQAVAVVARAVFTNSRRLFTLHLGFEGNEDGSRHEGCQTEARRNEGTEPTAAQSYSLRG